MSINLLPRDSVANSPFTGSAQRSSQAAASLLMDPRRDFGGGQNEPADRVTRGVQRGRTTDAACATVEVLPPDIVKRHTFALEGITVETVEATSCEQIEYRFRSSRHLLAVHEQGERRSGETFVEGLPKSSLHDLKKKLTFVPAGHEYRELQEPRIRSRVAYFYFDPAKMPIRSNMGFTDLAPRMHFDDPAIWETALKLSAGADNRLYLEALGVVLAHELVQLNSRMSHVRAPIRGGLAAWQQRVVAAYIEEHLAEQISIATLARLVRLSPFHFCRAFKQSFGMPPHRYHTGRRIECAKALLAKPAPSVTDIGFTVGYNETSAFSAAFRKTTGVTPTDYHRNL